MRIVLVAAARIAVAGIAVWGLIAGCGSPAVRPPTEPTAVEKIAFDNGWESIFVMNPDGTGVARIGAGSDPSFAPDGSRIVVGGRSIAVMDPDGVDVVELGEGGFDPTFAPDGTRIAFTRSGAIYVMDVSGGQPKQLTLPPDPAASGPDTVSSQEPAYSPDGARIVFTRYGGIWEMASDGSGARQLLADGHWNSSPVFTRDGTRIVFASNRGGKNRSELYVMRADGSDVRPLTDDWTVGPALSPDGSKILYTRNPAPASGAEIWVMNIDGSGAHRLTAPNQVAQNPSWGHLRR
ncbi:hypothetical protein NDR87_08965 [Nocardia sp. CDC159]|uniref:TolB protein n=1 Tax=Nocardia pulmonis TaxID=2951408 RepID=A0A9X2E4C7_9NOCA|nr:MULTISPECIES: hypothetical protein [Nocardia]MCM6773599.1 hypothetical protein [Nocardia pulmonis]MCM6786486.1 hypothetical protein [Nocardia sp. CDC159]